MLRGLEGERPQADRKIAHLPIPKNDPLYGANGPLKQLWISAQTPGERIVNDPVRNVREAGEGNRTPVFGPRPSQQTILPM